MASGKKPRPEPVVLTIPLGVNAREAFRYVSEGLIDGMARLGIRINAVSGGTLEDGLSAYGNVTSWSRKSIRIEVQPATWTKANSAIITLRLEKKRSGSVAKVAISGLEGLLSSSGISMLEWSSHSLLPALFRQLSPGVIGDWFVDSRARRPSGREAAATYSDPKYHWPSFLLVLDRIGLLPDDRLLEIGPGGGAFIGKALESGCTATAVDHSPEMVRLTTQLNSAAVAAGRLAVLQGDAVSLPVPDNFFTCCVCLNAFFFFQNPLLVLKEMRRALVPGGRLAIVTETPEARGSPAAPEPFATRSTFYEPESLSALAMDAGFLVRTVEKPDLGPYAESAGLPAEVVDLFRGQGVTLLMIAVKPNPDEQAELA